MCIFSEHRALQLFVVPQIESFGDVLQLGPEKIKFKIRATANNCEPVEKDYLIERDLDKRDGLPHCQ